MENIFFQYRQRTTRSCYTYKTNRSYYVVVIRNIFVVNIILWGKPSLLTLVFLLLALHFCNMEHSTHIWFYKGRLAHTFALFLVGCSSSVALKWWSGPLTHVINMIWTGRINSHYIWQIVRVDEWDSPLYLPTQHDAFFHFYGSCRLV